MWVLPAWGGSSWYGTRDPPVAPTLPPSITWILPAGTWALPAHALPGLLDGHLTLASLHTGLQDPCTFGKEKLGQFRSLPVPTVNLVGRIGRDKIGPAAPSMRGATLAGGLARSPLPILAAGLFFPSWARSRPDLQRPRHETHPYYDLRVKVLGARNIKGTDLLSEADCYVELRLPTASSLPARTRVVPNCSHPKWDETFLFRIQGAMKNVLELHLLDKDVLLSDRLSSLVFDLGGLRPGQTLRHIFQLSPSDSQELEVELSLEKSRMPPSQVITNGVLVARPCLRVHGTVSGGASPPLQGHRDREVKVEVAGACEKPLLLPQRPGQSPPPAAFSFHVDAELSSRLDLELRETRTILQSGPSPEVESERSVLGQGTIPLSSLPLGRDVSQSVSLGEGHELDVCVKTEMSSGHLDVRLDFDLCDGEREFLRKRKEGVRQALQGVLGLSAAPHKDEVPVVAVLGSGGGTRAMTALYGSLAGLQDLGLLDTVTYVGGISGSTWCLSTLYEDPSWSQSALEARTAQARAHACSSKSGAWSQARVRYYHRELQGLDGGVSLIHLWALLVEYFLHRGENPAKLSDQQAALCDGQNPLPVYAGVNVRANLSGQDFAEWVEFTPYEVGLPKYGAFVRTDLFGSEFFMGRLMKRLPEPRICFLEGIWASAFAASLDEVSQKLGGSGLGFLDSYRDSVNVIGACQPLQLPDPTCLDTRLSTPHGPFSQALLDFFTSRFSAGKNFNFTRGLCLHRDYLASQEFICKDSHPDTFPNQLTPTMDCLNLVDGGFAINSPFPLVLRPQRDVDVILSFDYSWEAPFEVLQLTEKYCQERALPFPRIQVGPGDLARPRECYVFAEAEDPRAPIVVHFPLVNRTFRTHRAPGVERESAEDEAFGDFDVEGPDSPYGTTNFTYGPRDFDRLVALSRYNVLNNAGSLRQALQLGLRRRRARIGASGPFSRQGWDIFSRAAVDAGPRAPRPTPSRAG
ncbi:cytosolic phospholipase A2 zeta [Tachyglossus aculeatus]|uniref:cytosolic phospholipase A2 zeta n=1 Tax=Tachyglossus aculeatus TaxID=9261 RepID=UPI0018F39C21|nr:cytosolic phospholipase A2 zeta [Tachyglossus aculeatus]